MSKPTENRTSSSKGKRKVKSGCKTCKARRVKCDESRPACRRCIATGRICDGYGIWGGGGSPYDPPPQSSKALSTYCTPVPVGTLDPEEQTCFEWFMNRTKTKFAGMFSSEFWETLVFQASAQEPAVRHAVVALSAAHRFDISAGSWIPAIYCSNAERFTLQQYNKAIHHLRIATSVAKNGSCSSNKKALHVALITCMLFVTLEYLRGQYKMGSAHLRYGIQLLADISAPTPRTLMEPGVLSPVNDFAHDALIDSYARLTVQSAMFGHVPSHLCSIVRDPQVHALPYTFSSLIEARRALDDLLNRIHCLNEYIDTPCSYSKDETGETPGNDSQTYETRRKILADLSLWRKAYNVSISLLQADSRKEKVGFMLLRVYHEMAMIMASVCLSSEGEMVFDAHTDDFVAVMKAFFAMWQFWCTFSVPIRKVDLPVALQSGRPSSDEGYSFTIESGFIPPMYYTGLKCRVPRIRRLAMRLLRAAPHREGVWNGPLLADVLGEVTKLEEGYSYADNYLKPHLDEKFVDDDFNFETMDSISPNVHATSRAYDVKVLLPDHVGGDTFISYKQEMDGGQWATFNRKVNRKEVPGSWLLC